MSFLIDPPLLYSSGRALAELTDGESPDRVIGAAATMAVFWGISVPLYLDHPWTRPVWKLCRARSGRDWMLNSGVFGLEAERAGVLTHLISGAIFATYPVWLALGMRAARRGRQAQLAGPTG